MDWDGGWGWIGIISADLTGSNHKTNMNRTETCQVPAIWSGTMKTTNENNYVPRKGGLEIAKVRNHGPKQAIPRQHRY